MLGVIEMQGSNVAWIVGLTACLMLAGCASPDTGDPGQTTDEEGMAALMETARSAAEGIDTPEDARAAGYVPDKYCIPGMGVHWINPSLLDTEIEPDKPEVLMFLPDDANLSDTAGDRFLGIEYVVATEGTEMNSSDSVPSLHGMPFEGPMAGHTPEMPWHAELHVYLAENLTDEMHHGAHPSVECPEGTTPPVADLVSKAREIARGLDSAEEARAAGYAPSSVCEPGMGVHWVNMAAFDTEVNVSVPEVLLFEPGPGGIYDVANSTLIGLEWVVVTQGTEMNASDAVPSLYNRSFDGPMPGHFPGMPWHAELHLYLGPDGSWAPFGEGHHAEAGNHTSHTHPKASCPEGTTPPPPMAGATLKAVTPDGIGEAQGNLTVTEGPFLGQLGITVKVSGLSEGKHGVHIHTDGDCSPTSTGDGPVAAGGAGGHFNPDDESHGNHSGDLGNIVVGSDGTGVLEVTKGPLTLEPGAHYSVLNRTLIVHQDEDDGETDPSGGSGPRELCGVIEAA